MAKEPMDVAALKRLAKRNAKGNGTPLWIELDSLAIKAGYQNWSVLTNNQTELTENETADQFVLPVYLRFGGLDREIPVDSVQLVVDPRARKTSFPWRALLVYVPAPGVAAIMADVRIDIYGEKNRVSADIDTALMESSANGRSVLVDERWPLFTWFVTDEDYLQFAGHGYWRAEQVLRSVNDLTFARATGYKPAWYDVLSHAALFEDPTEGGGYLSDEQDYAITMFRSSGFKRGSDGQRVASRLSKIEPGKRHAHAFQRWVADSLKVLFPSGLVRVRLNPNGQNAVRRDIVATNTGHGAFFARLLEDYRSRMVVFEAKNYSKPKPSDFRQVQAYLGAPHYGAVGFLVTHAQTKEIEEASWKQTRAIYNQDGNRKHIIVLPSALLAELLEGLWHGKGRQIDEVMEHWLEDALLRHFGN
jgi:hypothetical protein